MKIIYVSGPYRAPTEQLRFQNILNARDAAVKLWQKGWAVICPHLNTMHMGGIMGNDEIFLDGDVEIVKRCDAIFMLKGFENSEGACKEIEVAYERNITIYYEDGRGFYYEEDVLLQSE